MTTGDTARRLRELERFHGYVLPDRDEHGQKTGTVSTAKVVRASDVDALADALVRDSEGAGVEPIEQESRSLKENADAKSELESASGTAAEGFSPRAAPQRPSTDDVAELDRQIADYKRACDTGCGVTKADALWLLNEMIYQRDQPAAGAGTLNGVPPGLYTTDQQSSVSTRAGTPSAEQSDERPDRTPPPQPLARLRHQLQRAAITCRHSPVSDLRAVSALLHEAAIASEQWMEVVAFHRGMAERFTESRDELKHRCRRLESELAELRAGVAVAAEKRAEDIVLMAVMRSELSRLTSELAQLREFIGHEKTLMLKKLDEFHALEVEGRRPYFARLQAFAEVQQWLDRADRPAAALAGVPSVPIPEAHQQAAERFTALATPVPLSDAERLPESDPLAGVPSPQPEKE